MCAYDPCTKLPDCTFVHVSTGIDFGLNELVKGTLSPHKKISYMKHMDLLSTKNPSKNSSEYFNPPKNVLKVSFSVLNRAENVSMAPHYHPRMRQWLQNFIPIGVNGSRFSSLSASMAPDSDPRIW